MPQTVYCQKCTMTFRVEKPFYYNTTERTICQAPRCGRRFWHAQSGAGGPIRVGVLPEDVAPAAN